jgi:hypothetical protein
MEASVLQVRENIKQAVVEMFKKLT